MGNIKTVNFNPGNDTHDAAIVATDQGYRLFYTSINSNGDSSIFSVDSSDGIDFDQSSIQQRLIPDQSWSLRGISGTTIYRENDQYYLFYEGNNGKWNVGLATSRGGNSFTNCENNPLLTNDEAATSLLKLSDTYYLFFHSPNGIEYMETDRLGCDSVWKNRTVVFPYGFYPYVIQNGNELWMYYSTLNDGQWKMNLAISQLQVQTSEHTPVILIPGLFASWNKDALLHGQSVGQNLWQLNPIVKEYDGFTNTLEALGYRNNIDYFVFTYDWRQPVEKSAADLNSYISALNLTVKPDIVGHSLGGLVGRIYTQKYGKMNVDKLITVGSPHQGTALAYAPVEAGETDTRDPKMWLAEKVVLQLNKNRLETDREIIADRFPVLQDLLPTFNFLKKDGNDISINQMAVKNSLLPSYNESLGTIYSQLHTIVGKTGSTLLGYSVSERSILDSLLDIYPDGHPKDNVYYPGDGTVISFSASIGNDVITLNKSHGELIYTKEGISTVLQSLNVPFEPSQVVEGQGTTVFPSLLFLILSPARLEVTHNGHVYQDQEGIILAENPENGDYEVRARGIEKGKYTILIGQLTENGDIWNRIDGEITADPPSSQTDTYNMHLNQLAASGKIFDRSQVYSTLNHQVGNLEQSKNQKVLKALSFFRKIDKSHGQVDDRQTQAYLRQMNETMFQAYPTATDEEKTAILSIVETAELFYSYFKPVESAAALQKTDALLRKELIAQGRGTITKQQRYLLSILGQKIQSGEKKLADKDYSYAEILFQDAKSVMRLL